MFKIMQACALRRNIILTGEKSSEANILRVQVDPRIPAVN